MLKNNDTKKTELPDELAVTEEETHAEEESMLEDEFAGSLHPLELDNDDFDDWNPELEKIPQFSKPTMAAKPATPSLTPLDKKRMANLTIPAKFICPLSKQLMTEPVRIAGSKVPVAYEKSAIESHYEEHGTDPMTHDFLDDDAHFILDLALAREITDFCLNHVTKQESRSAHL